MKLLQAIRNNAANVVTCCNLLSGALACIASFHAFESWWWGLQGYQVAFILIFAAAIFDFFDGFTARLLKASSPLGKELDSLSDCTSFGLAPALVLYNMMLTYNGGCCSCWAYLALLIPVFGAVRLAKFNVSTNQTTVFTGLPIPANAIFWIGYCDLFASYAKENNGVPQVFFIVTLVLVVVFSLLMVCNLRMFSLKVHGFALKAIWKQLLIIVACVLLVVFLGIGGLAGTIVLYLVLSACTKQD